METMLVINNTGYASHVVQAIADLDCPVTFSPYGATKQPLRLIADRHDVQYLVESMPDFGVPSWIIAELIIRARYVDGGVTFDNVILTLPWVHRR